MQGIEGQWNGEVKIGGIEIPLHKNSLTSFFIFNTIHQHLPSLSMSFKDEGANFIANLGITDGAPITVDIGDGGIGSSGPMNFRAMGDLRIQGTHSAEHVKMSAVLDNIAWMRKIVQGSVKGTSGDAINKVASEAGLTPQIHSTSDAQVWLPTNKTLASHALHIAERGWASATSCMAIAVQDSGLLRYFNLDEVASGGLSKSFGVNGIPVLQHEVSSKSTLYNNSAGYGATSTTFDITGKFKELNQIAMTQFSGNLPISGFIQNAIGQMGGRIMPRPINVGNVHTKWDEAIHQNRRIKDTYAHDVNILVDTFSGVNLLDKVYLQLAINTSGDPLVGLTGDYIVTAFTRVLTGTRYFEKIVLTNQSMN